MKLLTPEVGRKLAPIYASEHLGLQAVAQAKFFTPDANWTWYASGFDGQDTFFGLVDGLSLELGYFSLSELRSIRGPLGLPVELDPSFKPQTLESLQKYRLGQCFLS